MGLKHVPVQIENFPFKLGKQFIQYGYTHFIETGTYLGDTSLEASKHFTQVYTIEAAEYFFKQAKEKCKEKHNVTLCLGDSREWLPQILIEKQNKVIFWLDAHYSGGETFNSTNPLLKELEIININTVNAIILIDDARFFHGMYAGERYCEYGPLFEALLCDDRYVSCIDDFFIAVPREFKSIVDSYSNEISINSWTTFERQKEVNKRMSLNEKIRKLLCLSK